MKRLAILGSTGSIGVQTLEVAAAHPDRFEVVAVAARANVERLARQAVEHRVRRIGVADAGAAAAVRTAVGARLGDRAPEVLSGPESLERIAVDPDVDVVVQAVSGAAGLRSSLAAVASRKTLALANKESLVVAGELLTTLASKSGASVVPIDSEHSAVLQCLRSGRPSEVRRVILTASGGPFWGKSDAEISRVSPEQAVRHPRWDMGPRISVDSATLVNKALEIVEAKWLFSLDVSRIDVVIHPQSIVHSLVEFDDGSVVAQMGRPDMRVPIRFALSYPDRLSSGGGGFDPRAFDGLTFAEPDARARRALDLGVRAARVGGTLGAALNAADEVAVEAFLERKIPFDRIVDVVEKVMERHRSVPETDVETVTAADAECRALARSLVEST
jgi:1-deoxy-D-xylulose-5-phosphate reductoisomerase